MEMEPCGSAVEPILIEPEEDMADVLSTTNSAIVDSPNVAAVDMFKTVEVNMNGVVRSLRVPVVSVPLHQAPPVNRTTSAPVVRVGRPSTSSPAKTLRQEDNMFIERNPKHAPTSSHIKKQIVIQKPTLAQIANNSKNGQTIRGVTPGTIVGLSAPGQGAPVQFTVVRPGLAPTLAPHSIQSVLVPVPLPTQQQSAVTLSIPQSAASNSGNGVSNIRIVPVSTSVSNVQTSPRTVMYNQRPITDNTKLRFEGKITPLSPINLTTTSTTLNKPHIETVIRSTCSLQAPVGTNTGPSSSQQRNRQLELFSLITDGEKPGLVTMHGKPILHDKQKSQTRMVTPQSSADSSVKVIRHNVSLAQSKLHTQNIVTLTNQSNIPANFVLKKVDNRFVLEKTTTASTGNKTTISSNDASRLGAPQAVNSKSGMRDGRSNDLGPVYVTPKSGVRTAASLAASMPKVIVSDQQNHLLVVSPQDQTPNIWIPTASQLKHVNLSDKLIYKPSHSILPQDLVRPVSDEQIKQLLVNDPISSNVLTLKDNSSSAAVFGQSLLSSVPKPIEVVTVPHPVSPAIANRADHLSTATVQMSGSQGIRPITGICINDGKQQPLTTPLYIDASGRLTSGSSGVPGPSHTTPNQLLNFCNEIGPVAYKQRLAQIQLNERSKRQVEQLRKKQTTSARTLGTHRAVNNLPTLTQNAITSQVSKHPGAPSNPNRPKPTKKRQSKVPALNRRRGDVNVSPKTRDGGPMYSNASNAERDTLKTILMGLLKRQKKDEQTFSAYNAESQSSTSTDKSNVDLGHMDDFDIEVLETTGDDLCFIDHGEESLSDLYHADLPVKSEYHVDMNMQRGVGNSEQEPNERKLKDSSDPTLDKVIKDEPSGSTGDDHETAHTDSTNIFPPGIAVESASLEMPNIKNEKSLQIDSVIGTVSTGSDYKDEVKNEHHVAQHDSSDLRRSIGPHSARFPHDVTNRCGNQSDTDSLDIDIEETDSADSDTEYRQQAMDVMFDKLAEYHKTVLHSEDPPPKGKKNTSVAYGGGVPNMSSPMMNQRLPHSIPLLDLFMQHERGQDLEELSKETGHMPRQSINVPHTNIEAEKKSLEDEINEISKAHKSASPALERKEFGRKDNKSSRLSKKIRKSWANMNECLRVNCPGCAVHVNKARRDTSYIKKLEKEARKDKKKRFPAAKGRLPTLYKHLYNRELFNIYSQRYPRLKLKQCSVKTHRLSDSILVRDTVNLSTHFIMDGEILPKSQYRPPNVFRGKEKYLMLTTTRGTFLLPVDGDIHKPAMVLTNEPVSDSSAGEGKVKVRVIRDWKPPGNIDPQIWRDVLAHASKSKFLKSLSEASQDVMPPATQGLMPTHRHVIRRDHRAPQSLLDRQPGLFQQQISPSHLMQPALLPSEPPVPQQLFMVNKDSGVTPLTQIPVPLGNPIVIQESSETAKRPFGKQEGDYSVKRIKTEHDVLQSLDNIQEAVVQAEESEREMVTRKVSSADRIKQLKERFKLMSEKAIGETRVALEKSKDVLREMDMV